MTKDLSLRILRGCLKVFNFLVCGVQKDFRNSDTVMKRRRGRTHKARKISAGIEIYITE